MRSVNVDRIELLGRLVVASLSRTLVLLVASGTLFVASRRRGTHEASGVTLAETA